MSLATAVLSGAAGVAGAALAASLCTRTQSIAIVGNRDMPEHCFAMTKATAHASETAADREFYETVRCQLDQRRGERVSVARTVYTPSFLMIRTGAGREKRYDVPAQRPAGLAWDAPPHEFLAALEQYECMARARLQLA